MAESEELEIDGDFNEEEETEVQLEYDIASYPSDLTLNVLNDMWERGEVIIPDYQRNFVWSKKQASMLIESFLIGLPVPQIFFYVNDENKYEVIDGQQRITSIISFIDGYFGSESIQGKKQVFRLTNLDKTSPFYNKTFKDLDEKWKRKFEGAILRAINIKQLKPQGESTISYHIFERLNTGGTPLKPQEIRNCVYRGEFSEILKKLNKSKSWRTIIKKPNFDKYQKDVEIILRLFWLSYDFENYAKPMKEFLNRGMQKHKKGTSKEVKEFVKEFESTISFLLEQLDDHPFHLRGPLNLPALESVFLVCYGKNRKKIVNLKEKVAELFQNKEFLEYSQVSTSDKSVIEKRLELSKKLILGR